MKQNKNLNQILQQALSPDEIPDACLKENILRRVKEKENMEKKQRRMPAAAIVAALTLSIGSVTAFAAWKYMTPDKVAEVMEEEGLMRAFQGEDAIVINESQICGEFKITLLGMVSGEKLRCYVPKDEETNQTTHVSGEIKEDKTYIVTAIEKINDTSATNEFDEDGSSINLTVSPLVKGLKPLQFNVYTMGGGFTAILEDGIEYRITESDNIEIFADRGLYLSVTEGSPSAEAYQYNEETGEITKNPSYEGVNALFQLPIDKSKGNPEAANQYLQAMGELEKEEENEELEIEGETLVSKVSQWSSTQVEEYATLLENLTQVLTPDKDGKITTAAYSLGNSGMEVGEGIYYLESLFEEKTAGETRILGVIGGDEEEVYVEAFTLNEDNTLTFKVYCYREKE